MIISIDKIENPSKNGREQKTQSFLNACKFKKPLNCSKLCDFKVMRTLIIDDEQLARKRIVNLLKEVKEIELIGECTNGENAISEINKQNPDLIFLDINMKDMNGFEVLQNIEVDPKPIVIFVTAYDEYALKAFDVYAFDFLLKPFKADRFFKTIKKVLEVSRYEAENNFEKRLNDLLKLYSKYPTDSLYDQKLPIKIGNKTIFINTPDIKYILGSGYYAEIYVDDKKHLLRESLSNLNETLNKDVFFRIHRSAIINLNYLKEIVHSEYSEIDVRMKDNKLIKVSRSNKKEFLQKMGV